MARSEETKRNRYRLFEASFGDRLEFRNHPVSSVNSDRPEIVGGIRITRAGFPADEPLISWEARKVEGPFIVLQLEGSTGRTLNRKPERQPVIDAAAARHVATTFGFGPNFGAGVSDRDQLGTLGEEEASEGVRVGQALRRKAFGERLILIEGCEVEDHDVEVRDVESLGKLVPRIAGNARTMAIGTDNKNALRLSTVPFPFDFRRQRELLRFRSTEDAHRVSLGRLGTNRLLAAWTALA